MSVVVALTNCRHRKEHTICGIVYKQNLDGLPVNNDILQQFDKQRSRGTQGFGLFDGKFNNIIKATKEDKILKWLVNYESDLIMFHHRYPTSTGNVKSSAHPFSTGKYFGNTCYILIQNGNCRNSKELFADHAKLDIEYKTLNTDLKFNDSEAFLWDFALTMEGKQDKLKSTGDSAFICIKLVDNKLDTMYFGRNFGRPLALYRNKDTFELSSEGRGDMVKAHTLYTYNYKAKRLTKKPMSFTNPSSYTPQYSQVNNRNWDYTDWEEMYLEDDDSLYDVDEFGMPHYRAGRSEPGSWVGPALRKKLQKYIDNGEIKIGPKNTAPALPMSTFVESTIIPVRKKSFDPDYIIEHLNDFQPATQEIQTKVMNTLSDFNGHFEQAYWQLEAEYDEAMDAPDDAVQVRKRLLIEAAMAFLQSDPDYKDVESISNTWRSVCHQQTILA